MPGRVCRLRSANGNSKKAQRSGVSGHSPDHNAPLGECVMMSSHKNYDFYRTGQRR